MENKDDQEATGKDGAGSGSAVPAPASALKSESESKYQGALLDSSFEDGASVISALAFGTASPVRPAPTPSRMAETPPPGTSTNTTSSTAVANTTATATTATETKNSGKASGGVAFHDQDTIIAPPPDLHRVSSNNNNEAASTKPGPGHLRANMAAMGGAGGPKSMAYLYSEGRLKSYRNRVTPANVVRKENKVDIESGESVWRQMSATPIYDMKEPMNPLERRKLAIQKYADDEKRPHHSEDDGIAQYRLHSAFVNRKNMIPHDRDELIPMLTTYLHWTFRASFFSVVVTDFIAFFLICLFWACCIYIGALYNPRCFVSGGTTLSEIEDWRQEFYFRDAFQLSWTTFSTVGYGVVYPQVNRQTTGKNLPSCAGFTFIVTVESFVGILFGAFCGSIIFGKIARIQSIAQIQFSQPIVIRYGTGVLEHKVDDGDGDDDDDDDDDDNDEDENDETEGNDTSVKEEVSGMTDKSSSSMKSSGRKTVKYPPPVLEFRVINRLNMQSGGEIMNASVNVVASTSEAQGLAYIQLEKDHEHHGLLRMSKELTHATGKAFKKTKNVTALAASVTGKALLRGSVAAKSTTGSMVQKLNRSIVRAPMSDGSVSETDESAEEPYNNRKKLEQLAFASLASAYKSSRHMVCDEGNTEGLVPRRIFSKLEVETDTHPFFKRVWVIRHVLNDESPLLTPKAQRIVRVNKGQWPQDICNPKFIRDNFKFHQIIVSLSGTQNSSGSAVFGMTVYEFDSVNVGYTFAKMLDVNAEKKLFVDESLLNDVHAQKGGGAEDIHGNHADEFGEGTEMKA